MGGQAALEYMILVGLLFLALTPLIYIYHSSMIRISSAAVVEGSADKLKTVADNVFAMGYPASEIVSITIPEGVIGSRTYVINGTLQISYYSRTGETIDVVRALDFPVNGALPTSSGVYFMKVSATPTGNIDFSLMSFYAYPDNIYVSLSNDNYENVNVTIFNTKKFPISVNVSVLNLENKVDMNASTVINENQTVIANIQPNMNASFILNVTTLMKRGNFFGQLLVEGENETIAIPVTLSVYVDPLVAHWTVNSETEFNAGAYNDTFYNSSAGGVTLNKVPDYEELLLTDSDIAADIYVRSSTSFESQMKFDISSLPSPRTIEEVRLCLYINLITGSPDDDLAVSRIDDQNWDEHISASEYNAQTETNNSVRTMNSTSSLTWTCFEVTEVISTDYALGHAYSTVRFEDPDYALASAGNTQNDRNLRIGKRTWPNKYYNFRSRTETSPDLRPYLWFNLSRIAVIGEYYSKVLDANQSYVWHNVTFHETGVELQVRSNYINSSWPEFTGPDGTNNTYYSNGNSLNTSSNRYFQFKVVSVIDDITLNWVKVTYGE